MDSAQKRPKIRLASSLMLGWAGLLIATSTVVAQSEAQPTRSAATRKIPVLRPRPNPAIAPGDDTVRTVANQEELAQQYPVPIRPGEITSVEVRNGAGEIVSGELAEGEFIVGPRPAPVRIGQPYGPSPGMVESPGYGPTLAPALPDDMAYDSLGLTEVPTGDCPNCDAMSCDGLCRSGAATGSRGTSAYDARVEAIARALANPLADFWVRAEYLTLAIDGAVTPALITTGNATTPFADAGVLGEPGTRVLFGGGELIDDQRNGGRIEIGKYLPGDNGLGVSASILFSDRETETFSADSNQFPVLARPFFDVEPAATGNNAELIGYPGRFAGNVSVDSSSRFGAGDVLLRALMVSRPGHQLETFVGYTYLSLDDDLAIRDFRQVVGTGTALAVGTTLSEVDEFRTTNDFHGLAIGGQSTHCVGGWSLLSSLRLGIGVTDASVTRAGSTRATVPLVGGGTSVDVQNSGLLVQGTNRGTINDEELSIAPELRLVLQRRLLNDWNATIGYEFLYWSRVLRAGEQIDPLVNLTQLPPGPLTGLTRPEPLTQFTDVLVHGVSIGLFKEF